MSIAPIEELHERSGKRRREFENSTSNAKLYGQYRQQCALIELKRHGILSDGRQYDVIMHTYTGQVYDNRVVLRSLFARVRASHCTESPYREITVAGRPTDPVHPWPGDGDTARSVDRIRAVCVTEPFVSFCLFVYISLVRSRKTFSLGTQQKQNGYETAAAAAVWRPYSFITI